MERIYLDGWEVTENASRGWESREGTDEFAGFAGTDPAVPSRDGTIWRTKTLEPGVFQLVMWCRGVSYATARAQWENVVRVVNRRLRPIVIRRTIPNGEHLEALASLMGSARPVHVGQTAIRATLTFAIPDGRWYATTPVTAASATGATATRTISVTGLAPATAPSPLTVKMFGPFTTCTVTDTTDQGAYALRPYLTYKGAVPNGGHLTLNSETWALTPSGFVLDAAAVDYSGRRYLEVEQPHPGVTPSLQVKVTGGGTATKVEVTARRAHAF